VFRVDALVPGGVLLYLSGWLLNVSDGGAFRKRPFLAAVLHLYRSFLQQSPDSEQVPAGAKYLYGRYKVEVFQHERPLNMSAWLPKAVGCLKREGRRAFIIQFLSSLFGLASLLFGLLLTGFDFLAAILLLIEGHDKNFHLDLALFSMGKSHSHYALRV